MYKQTRRTVAALVDRAIHRTHRKARPVVATLGSLSPEAVKKGADDLMALAFSSPEKEDSAPLVTTTQEVEALRGTLRVLIGRLHAERAKDRRNVRLDVVENWIHEEGSKFGITFEPSQPITQA